MGDLGQKPQNAKKNKFANLLILEHLKNHFTDHFEVFCPDSPFIYTTLIAVKTFLLLKHHLLSINLREFT